MATPTNSTSAPVVFLPKLSFSKSSLDLASDSSTPNSETTTLNDRHDSLKESPRSSIDSAKPPKRVRFQESVCWSYFDVDNTITPYSAPTTPLNEKPSFLGRSWARFKSRNSSDESLGLNDIKRRNSSMDALSKVTTNSSGRPVLTRRSSSSSSTVSMYSVQQPLRESAGRRYDAAETRATWRRSAAAEKGSWDDLLSNPRQSRLYA